MSDSLAASMAVLAEVLRQENRLLSALDLASATTLVPAKQRAVEAFGQAQARAHRQGGPEDGMRPALVAATRELAGLASENRRLLQRGMAAQVRVIAVLARAARNVPGTASRYGATGAPAGRPGLPLAISARI